MISEVYLLNCGILYVFLAQAGFLLLVVMPCRKFVCTSSRNICADVASNWLSFFPSEARKNVYDIFFLDGNGREVVQTLIPLLHGSHGANIDSKAVASNIERWEQSIYR